jgi:hypothetical protein
MAIELPIVDRIYRRDMVLSTPSRLAGEGRGGGYAERKLFEKTPLPTGVPRVDLPHKGGGGFGARRGRRP